LFFIKILFAVFNVSFVGYSLAKNNLNNTYQYNMISKNVSKTMNYLIILIKFKVSHFLCRSVYIQTLHYANPERIFKRILKQKLVRKKFLTFKPLNCTRYRGPLTLVLNKNGKRSTYTNNA
jgi:hypothetical protein